MKKSEFKKYIKEMIISELTEAEQGIIHTKDQNKAEELAKKGLNVSIDETDEEKEDNWGKVDKEDKEYEDKEPTKSDIASNASVAKLQSKYSEVVKQMKSIVNKYKSAEGSEKNKYVDQLRNLTKLKKELETMINPSMDDEEEI